MFKQYRKKPIVVGAMLWEGTSEQKEFISTNMFSDRDLNVTFGKDDSVSFDTYDNRLTVHKGKYIICGTKGELYPCKADIFAHLYDEAFTLDKEVAGAFGGADFDVDNNKDNLPGINRKVINVTLEKEWFTPIQKQMIDFTLRVRQLEESMHTCVAFNKLVEVTGSYKNDRAFRSQVLIDAHKELRNARMFCGDILRLFGIENPHKNAYTGKLQQETAKYMENGELVTINWEADVLKEVPTDITHSNESLCLAYMKNSLGNAKERSGLFYEFNDKLESKLESILYKDHNKKSPVYSTYEKSLYILMVKQALKKANCYLGLRFGELV